MKKESIVYHSQEILTEKIRNQGNVMNKLVYYTKDHDYHKFDETLRKHLFNPETRNDEGMTLLSIAVQCGSHDIIKYLIEMGAELNTQDVIFVNLEISEFSVTLRFN
jgi:ankyrin repeat protein